MELQLRETGLYRVKKGQRLKDIASAFRIPPRVLASRNGLKEEPREGALLKIPSERRDLYTVRGGESKTLLCGSSENFEERNCTKWLYPGQIVWL